MAGPPPGPVTQPQSPPRPPHDGQQPQGVEEGKERACGARALFLCAVTTPDNRLGVFTVGSSGLVHRGSVPVGLEPVAVAARSDDEAWVVNHLSDSVSVVRLSDDGSRG